MIKLAGDASEGASRLKQLVFESLLHRCSLAGCDNNAWFLYFSKGKLGRPVPQENRKERDAQGVHCDEYSSISDPQKLEAYAKIGPAAVAPFGARILARGNAAAAYEYGLKERIVIVEYPSLEKAIAARE
jgi:uncharacterized protein DUF1330